MDVEMKYRERTRIRSIGQQKMTRFYTGPQPTVISEWSETLNNVAVEEFSSFTGSVTHRL